ncbi:MAG: GNAT family N-acetyltransferase [Candidatus Thiodiazotropha sp.]|jgi:ribosomal protein S18 acetylase RimI-like enzyme
MKIRKYQETDWNEVWSIIGKVFRAGDTYAFSPEITEQEAHKVWIEKPQETYVVTADDTQIIGTYYIKPNQPELGAHVCNCGYVVSEDARGQGVASKMCEHSQWVAVEAGFRAMQFNLVVSTNEGAVRLWEKMGFQIIGVLPNAFKSKSVGYVDALVMYKQLAI